MYQSMSGLYKTYRSAKATSTQQNGRKNAVRRPRSSTAACAVQPVSRLLHRKPMRNTTKKPYTIVGKCPDWVYDLETM